MKLTGLTSSEVAQKIAQGKVNKLPKKATTDTIPKIILRSTLTLFNLVNLVLGVLIVLVCSYKNLLFIIIAIANTLISIINEVRAKRTIDKMRILAEQQPTVIRDGQSRQIPADQIVEGDLMVLSIGDQILVDSRLATGEIEVNESFITGEQDNIQKHPGDKLISGSFVVSGSCQAVVTSVGADNYLAKLESSAKSIKSSQSKLFTIMNNIVKYISFALIPIGLILLWRQFTTQSGGDGFLPFATLFTDPQAFLSAPTTEVAVTSTVAALINMIPEGLILLTSSVLALATIRLSRKQVLVQDLYSIETLARVDTICLDKTGTLTTGHMTVKDLIPNPANSSKKSYVSAQTTLQDAFKAILSRSTSDNATSTALKAKLLKTAKFTPTEPILEFIPFSSDRKYSGIRTATGETLMGALEFITTNPEIHAQAADLLKTVQNPDHYRIISVVQKTFTSPKSSQTSQTTKITKTSKSAQITSKQISTSVASATLEKPIQETFLGLALLEDEIRPDAPEIIKYFVENDVNVRIISGDNLETVKQIAEKVGVPETASVDLCAEGPRPNFDRLVKDYQIFTRVTPSQKKQLIAALKKQGHTVAMTGDGVNDILAMKEADCSIAIGAGADAARRAARLVLLNSDFASVPSIIAEGRQTINNLERSTTLFLTKTIYASILAVIFAIAPLEYPYSPIEMSLLNFLCIGMPGLVLALETNTARVKDLFAHNIKKYSLPTGLVIAVTMLILAILDAIFHFARSDLLTISMVATFIISISLIYRISRPLNAFRGSLLAVIVAIFLAAVLIPPIRLIFIG